MNISRGTRRGLYTAAALAALQALGGGTKTHADILLNDFETGTQGWHQFVGQVSGIGTFVPTGGTTNWLFVGFKSTADAGGSWDHAGPTVQGDNPNFTNSNFQANNFMQMDLIFPSQAALGVNAWRSNDTALPIFIKTNSTTSGEVFTQLGTVDTTVKDTPIHVILPYGAFKASGGGTLQVNTNFMNLEFGHFDETAWGTDNPAPIVFIDNIYWTATTTINVVGPNNGSWDVTKSGNWSDTANWVGGIRANGPNNAGTFGPSTAPRTVTVDTGISIGSLNIDSANGYTFSGANPIQLAGAAPTINVNSGSHSMAIVTFSGTATFNIAGSSSLTINDFTSGGFGSVVKTGAGALSVDKVQGCSLNVADGSLSLGTGVSSDPRLFTITVAAATAFLDVGTGSVYNNNNIFGTGTIRVPAGARFNTGLSADYGTGSAAFTGNFVGGGSVVIGGAGAGQDHTVTWMGNNTLAGGVTVAQGTLIAKNLRGGPITVADPGAVGGGVSKLQIAASVTPNDPAATSVTTALTIQGAGQVDLTNNSMIVDYTGPVGTLVSDTRNQLRTGSLSSSVTDATHKLGYGDNALLHKSTFAGQSVDTSSVLIKYTYAGDADLDGDADGVDIGTWATNFTGELGGAGSAVWTQGDWDYDGDVDGVDAGLWAQAFTGELGGAGLGSLVVDDPNIAPGAAAILRGMGITVVPEPATITGLLAGIGAAAMTGRRDRRRK
ncbi:MAG TPA: PEP-CTERM sorting domain-containing protein [Tepidisphaeraceae bacterium]|jgi:hypothetical protein